MKKNVFCKNTARFLSVLLLLICLVGFVGCVDEFSLVKKTASGLCSYNIEAGFDDATKTVTAVLNFDFKNNTESELTELKFHLYPNAFREDAAKKIVSPTTLNRVYKNGYSFGDISIETVKQGGADLAFSIGGEDCNILIVPISAPLEAGQKTTIEISFETKLANIWHRTGYGDHTVNLNNWYPILCYYDAEEGWRTDCYNSFGDPFFCEASNYYVNISVDENYKLAVGGDLIKQEKTDSTIRYCFEAEGVRDFSIVMSPDFQQKTMVVGKTQIDYYFFDDEHSDETLQMSADAVTFFNKSFGQYPYGTLAVVQSDFFEGGMEYPRLAMVSFGLPEKAYKKATVHEIAHQWWYGVVGNDQIKNAWLDEGLAEYSTYMFFEEYDFGIDSAAEIEASKQSLHNFLDITGNYFVDIDTSMNRSLTEFRNETEYAYMAYIKSMIMFDDIKNMMGKHRFLRALKDFYSQNLLCVADQSSLAKSFSKAYGSDMSKIFETYTSGKEKTIKSE